MIDEPRQRTFAERLNIVGQRRAQRLGARQIASRPHRFQRPRGFNGVGDAERQKGSSQAVGRCTQRDGVACSHRRSDGLQLRGCSVDEELRELAHETLISVLLEERCCVEARHVANYDR